MPSPADCKLFTTAGAAKGANAASAGGCGCSPLAAGASDDTLPKAVCAAAASATATNAQCSGLIGAIYRP